MNMPSIACLFFPKGLEDSAGRSLAEACLRFSSQVALRQGQAVFLECGRSALLFSRPSLSGRLHILARRHASPDFTLAFGRNAAEALAMARWMGAPTHRTKTLRTLPLQALLDFASPFQTDQESEASLLPMLTALASLGLKDLGHYLDLPPRTLGARFGPEAALLRQRVAGDFDMAWPRFEPAPRLEESAGLRDLESLEA
jgi:hypothetical protein